MIGEHSLTPADFDRLAEILRREVGIELGETKQSLLLARLGSLMRTLGMDSYGQLADAIDQDPGGPLMLELVNRLSTNHTYFNREERHFLFLRESLLPFWRQQMLRGERKRFRIWSAACSTGEETYNIAMTIADETDLRGSCRVLGTDISSGAIEKARRGTYTPQALAKLSPSWRERYVRDVATGGEIVPQIREMVVFRRMNLIRERFPFRNSFDLVFCRNVLIYFHEELRARVVENLVRSVEPGGYLVVGHSETVDRNRFGLSYVQPGIYKVTGQLSGRTAR